MALSPKLQLTLPNPTDNANVPQAFTDFANSLEAKMAPYIYPIGSIYQSTSSTSPASLFGCTWETYGAGRVLVGAGTSDATYSAGSTGGSSKVIIAENQLPRHYHTDICYLGGYVKMQGSGTNTWGVPLSAGSASVSSNSFTTGDVLGGGSGQPHENMPPYIVVNRWRRTA